MIRYELQNSDYDSEDITLSIGFSSQLKQGLLMQITNDPTEHPAEYISVRLNNQGTYGTCWTSILIIVFYTVNVLITLMRTSRHHQMNI